MAHYLLIARFTMDDIPLALLKDKSWAEKHAKDLQADPSLLDTKWKKAVDVWPAHDGDFAGAVVLHLDVMGDPVGVTFDSTYDDKDIQPPDPQPIQSTIPVPDGYVEITDPNHSLRPYLDLFLAKYNPPDKWMPITDTDAVFIRDWCEPGYRFCCPAERHPDRKPTPLPAETNATKFLREANDILVKNQVELVNDIEILRKANADLLAENNTLVATRTQLHKTVSELLEERSRWTEAHVPELQGRYEKCSKQVEELQAVNAILKKDNDHLRLSNIGFGERNASSQAEIRDLHAKVAHLQAEYNRVADLNSQLERDGVQWARTVVELKEQIEEKSDQVATNERAFEALADQNAAVHQLNASLRQLNEDLNHRLNATLARASQATDLESRIRGMAVRLLRFAEDIGNRAKWSKVFGNEGLMPPAYHKAMAYCWTDFTFQLEEFVRAFPHVSPDMPDHLKIDAIDPGDEADDDDGTTD